MLVLLVEDSETQSMYYEAVLGDAGLEVYTAADGRTALDYAHQYRPDIIVLDINLPDMDGFQVCSRLSRAEETRNIPIIMLTARDSADDAWAGIGAGAVDYIAKDDFAVDTLLASLRQLGFSH